MLCGAGNTRIWSVPGARRESATPGPILFNHERFDGPLGGTSNCMVKRRDRERVK